jgi:tetratricopeptide (TPR) repeat protein
MLPIAFALLTIIQSGAQPQDEIKDALAHADALYYAARFNESIALLERIDDVLKAEPGRIQEKIDTKLKLALAHIGLNDTNAAKSSLMALYALDPDYALDGRQFSPKVIAIASDAKMEQTKVQCFEAQTDARKSLDSGQAMQFLDLLRLLGSKCTVLAAMAPEAAETFYRAGVASYKRGEFSTALPSFETALMLSPEHELARQYAELAQGKLELGQDRLLVQWQRDFDTHQFPAAAAEYRQIMSASGGRSTTVSHVRDEYRKALSSLVEKWNRMCVSGDAAAISAISGQISELLPESSFGEDIRGQMTPCEETKEPARTTAASKAQSEATMKTKTEVTPIGARVNNTSSCIGMQAPLALARLKTRVDPVVTNDLRRYLTNNRELTVRVKARINETGDVTVTGMPDGNPALNNLIRDAVSQWKFTPIRDDNGPRCAETEIPMVLKLGQ